jgi:chemosensory pili system protein ChpE
MLFPFLSAVGFGIAFCAPPGVVTAQALRRGLEGGFTAALLLELGSLIGDATWAIIALIGAAVLVQNMLTRLLLGSIGVLLLLYLSSNALKDAYEGKIVGAKQVGGRSDFALGAALSLTNPLAIAFWLGVGSVVISRASATTNLDDVAVFFTGFMLGALLWCFFIASLIAWGRRFVTPRFFRLVNLLCGLALGIFAIKLLWNTILLLKG